MLTAVIKTKFSLTSNALIVCKHRAPACNRPFWVKMMGQPRKLQRPKVFRHFLYAVGLFAGLIPGLTHAQTSIDAGKSPGEIFQTVCTTCHKSARGLANGRGSSGLASFLAEHYTSGKDQAAQLAAYVMGAGGGEAAPATQARKPAPDSSRTATEESKPSPQRQKPEPPGASARLQPPASEEPKQRPGDVPSIVQERGRKPAGGRAAGDREPRVSRQYPSLRQNRQRRSPLAQRRWLNHRSRLFRKARRRPQPANADAGETAPVPRDNIPD